MKKIEDIPDERKNIVFPTNPECIDVLERMKIHYFEKLFKPEATPTGKAKWHALEVFFDQRELHFDELIERAKREGWYISDEVFMIAFFSVKDWAETGGQNMTSITF